MVPTLDANFFAAASAWRMRDIVRSEDSSCQRRFRPGRPDGGSTKVALSNWYCRGCAKVASR
jgi:hypothetical protein